MEILFRKKKIVTYSPTRQRTGNAIIIMEIHFKENLKYLRKLYGYSQTTLAEHIGVTRAVIGSYEEGRAMPSIQTLLKIANHFDLFLDTLITIRIEDNQDCINGNEQK